MCKGLMAAVLLGFMQCVFAAPSPACSAPVYHRLDFWLGDWDTYEANGQGPSEARNHVTSILGGCVILERYQGTNGELGESFTIYDASRKVWHQTWVTNRGQLLVLEGRFKGYELTLQGVETLAGSERELIRGIWKPQLDGVREMAYISKDGGKTWAVDFDILFKPHRGK
ncbi:MAG: hypothetical protein WCC11_06175 [Gammaproteobacteria bacterium]